jgi:hypothetical protein
MYADAVVVKYLSIGKRMDGNLFRWYGHVERIEDKRIVERVYCVKVEGTIGRDKY